VLGWQLALPACCQLLEMMLVLLLVLLLVLAAFHPVCLQAARLACLLAVLLASHWMWSHSLAESQQSCWHQALATVLAAQLGMLQLLVVTERVGPMVLRCCPGSNLGASCAQTVSTCAQMATSAPARVQLAGLLGLQGPLCPVLQLLGLRTAP
jgi:hypothetical protein